LWYGFPHNKIGRKILSNNTEIIKFLLRNMVGTDVRVDTVDEIKINQVIPSSGRRGTL